MSADKKEPQPSKAPAPLEPVRSSGTIVWNHFSSTVQKPRWNEWNNTPNVTQWQACALSLGIEPNAIRTNNSSLGGTALFAFKESSFPDTATKDEFELRQRVLWANLNDPNRDVKNFPSAKIHYANPSVSTVALAEFAAWAVSVVKWEGMPPELLALVRKPDTPTASDTDTQATAQQNEAAVSAQTNDNGLSKREKQIRAIESIADVLQYNRLAIPDGGKKIIQTKCKLLSSVRVPRRACP